MQISFWTQGFDLTAGLRQHAERRLRFAVGWASDNVSKVSVRLSDINGPRGGNDKRCQVRVSLPGAREVVIEETDPDLYSAIDRAADRTERTVARRLARLRDFPHIRISASTSFEADTNTVSIVTPLPSTEQ